MRSCLDYWQISRYPQPCSLYEKKQLEDATNLPRNSSQHQIKDYGVGLLAILVENCCLLILLILVLNLCYLHLQILHSNF
jgi:hypothetical protein